MEEDTRRPVETSKACQGGDAGYRHSEDLSVEREGVALQPTLKQTDDFFTGSGSALQLILERKRKHANTASPPTNQPLTPTRHGILKPSSGRHDRSLVKKPRLDVAQASTTSLEEEALQRSPDSSTQDLIMERKTPLTPTSLRKIFLTDRQAMELLNSDLVLAQYPYMADVAFLVSVICDADIDDKPIIYVNENFEGMTLFRREEILGRNCRFMQGKCTNPETVKQIAETISKGVEMEVEILNYRRNGVPFWNKFLLLPIRTEDRSRVRYWCAIQQDITILREMGSNPKNWTPHEVGMWLDHVDFGDYSLRAVHSELTGIQLLYEPLDFICDMLQMKSDDDKEILKGKINFLKEKPELSFSSSSLSNSMVSLQMLHSLSPKDGEKRVRFDKTTFFHSENRDKITIKCLFADEVQLFSIRRDASINRVRNKLNALFPNQGNLKIEGVSKEGQMLKLENDDDLRAFVESILDGNLCLQPKALIRITPDDATISKEESSSSTKLEAEKDDRNSSCN